MHARRPEEGQSEADNHPVAVHKLAHEPSAHEAPVVRGDGDQHEVEAVKGQLRAAIATEQPVHIEVRQQDPHGSLDRAAKEQRKGQHNPETGGTDLKVASNYLAKSPGAGLVAQLLNTEKGLVPAQTHAGVLEQGIQDELHQDADCCDAHAQQEELAKEEPVGLIVRDLGVVFLWSLQVEALSHFAQIELHRREEETDHDEAKYKVHLVDHEPEALRPRPTIDGPCCAVERYAYPKVDGKAAEVAHERPLCEAKADAADRPEQLQDPVLRIERVPFHESLVEDAEHHADDAADARDIEVDIAASQSEGWVEQGRAIKHQPVLAIAAAVHAVAVQRGSIPETDM
mmetsp:Transcript_44517/g.102902  ORF Transcript_44517/g.102902 Transcript_44517/m.102902 type:complete len:343 (-) Transcript_44517:8-1036(-)